MRKLHTIVCAAILAGSCLATAQAQGAGGAKAVHPTLGKKPPKETLSRDISALPLNEQYAWLHGALSQMIATYAGFDQEASGCLADWAFLQGDGLEILPGYLKRYPDQPASVVVYAVAKQACGGI